MKPLRAIALLGGISSAAFAADKAPGYGVGMHSCAEFAQAYAADPTTAEDLYFSWAQGFMSGVNLAYVTSTGSYRYINGNEMLSQKSFIRSYCDAHPQAQYSLAVMDLLNSFPIEKAK